MKFPAVARVPSWRFLPRSAAVLSLAHRLAQEELTMAQVASRGPYTKGLHDLGDGCYAYLQPDGSWGWSNAGLVVDSGQSLLVDTLFDLKLTREILDAMHGAEPAA